MTVSQIFPKSTLVDVQFKVKSMFMQVTVIKLRVLALEKLYIMAVPLQYCYQEMFTFKDIHRMHLLTPKGLHYMHTKLYRIW